VGECATGEMAARQTKGAAVNVSTHSLVARVLTEPDSEP
jgi:hypothetical protein